MVAGMASSIQPTDTASYVRSGFVVAAALVLVVAVTATVITDDAPTPRPPLAGAAANGLIAYSYAGDIHVGDPVTGETVSDRHAPTVRGQSGLLARWHPHRVHAR